MLVILIFISFLLCCVGGLGGVFFVFSFFLASLAPCGRGGVRGHPREGTRSGGTEPARYPPVEAVQASAGTGGAVRPPWIPRNRPHAARAGALKRLAAAYEAGARSLPRTAGTRRGGSG